MSAAQKPMRLPPLRRLRVHNPNGTKERPCVGIMSTVLTCWASTGYSPTGCAQVEAALRACMDGPKPPQPKGSQINKHLSQFKDRVTLPAKKRK
ncbi:mitochondrial ribosomal protein 10 [Xylariaceae sp. FL0594]|nr:mitochondrial ribosomal protein 10 [Xylariaceae sp. FL0594]